MASFFMMPLRAKGNQSPGQSLEEVIAKHWRDVFEAFQLEDEEDGSVRAHKVAKEMQLMGLNHGVSNLCIDEDKDNQDASNILSDLMVQTYVPACLSVVAAEQVDDLDVKKRLLDFMAKVAIQLGNTHRHKMIQLATDASLALSDPVRALACFLLGQLSATEALIPRLTDKSIAVRFAAISATQHVLKSSEDFALLEALLWNVWHEPSVPNRVAAVQALPAKDDIWDHVIARLRDVKEKVRVAALQGLHQTQSLEQLTSSQMAEILQSGMGLEARCPATKDAIMRLICSHWMKLSKFNPLHFLKSMDILSNDDEAEYVLRVVLSVANEASPSDYLASLSSPEKKAFHSSIVGQLITLEENNTSFTLEQYFLARVAAAYNEEYLTKVVPDMGVLCDVFQQYSRELVQSISEGSKDKQDQSLFVCLQLLQLATLVGMQEEGSRRRFTALLEAILTIAPAAEIPDELIEAAVKALLTLHGVTDGKIKENGMRSRHEDSMISTVLQDIMNHLLELGDDNVSVRPHCTMRILSIFSIILEEAPPTSGIIRDFVKVVSPIILNSVSTSGNDLLREAGVSCLGKLGFFSEKIAVINDYKPLLLALASNEEESLTVRSQAMMALSDWTLVFDEILEPMDSGLSFVKVLNYLLKSTNTSVAAIAAEATAKLLFANRVCDSTLIAFLLVLFFDPITKESASTEIGSTARIQQWLSLFFQAYCLQSAEARDALLGSIETALMLAVTKNVERKKKKVAFPVVKLVEYVCEVVTIAQEEAQKALQLTDAEMAEREEDSRTAFMVALQVAQFVLSAEEQELSLNITQLRGLCKLLGSLSVQSTPGISKLQQIMEELGMVLTDGTSLRSLTLLTQELADLHEEGEKGISGRESNASTLSEVTGCESDASTITEISNKENPRPRSTKVARPSSDSTFSVASSRMTRSVLKSSNMGV